MRIHGALLLFGIVLCSSGCRKPEVDFADVFTKPTATIQGTTPTLTGGPHRLASIHYVAPRTRIEKDTIYVYGIMTTDARAVTNRVSLPSPPQGGWKIKWVNRNGTMMQMTKK